MRAAAVTITVPAARDWRVGKRGVEAALSGTREKGVIVDESGRVRATYRAGVWTAKEDASARPPRPREPFIHPNKQQRSY